MTTQTLAPPAPDGIAELALSEQEDMFVSLTVAEQLCGIPVLAVRDILGPQVITRHGRAVVRVVSASQAIDTAEVTGAADGFAQYLLKAPRLDGLELPVRRSRKSTLTLGG